jgi:hypothetical protein
MFGLSYFLSRSPFSEHKRPPGSAARHTRRLRLEELEPRDVLAPVAVGTVALAATIPTSPPTASVAIVASSTLGASLHLPSLTSTAAYALTALSIGSSTLEPFIGFGPTTLLPIGAPNPVRTGPAGPLTPGADARMLSNFPYVLEDVSLSGGGGGPTEQRNLPPANWNPDDPQTRIEASAVMPQDPDAATSALLGDVLFQLSD